MTRCTTCGASVAARRVTVTIGGFLVPTLSASSVAAVCSDCAPTLLSLFVAVMKQFEPPETIPPAEFVRRHGGQPARET